MEPLGMNDGRGHPSAMFGTYKIGFIPGSASGQNGQPGFPDHDIPLLLKQALDSGCRAFDCASYYGNEGRVGEALAKLGTPREELFLASKVWCDAIYDGPEAVRASFEKTCSDLRTPYLDLYLVHWPVPGKHVAAYKVLEELQREGKVRSIGVSNYTIEDFEELKGACAVTPAVNQIEINPFLFRAKTIDYFRSQGVVLQAYRGLANGKALDSPIVQGIARRAGRTPAQVMGRFLVQQGIALIFKSSRPERVAENLALDFVLPEPDLQALRQCTTPEAVQAHAALYRKCVVRDTPLQAQAEAGQDVGIKQDATFD